MSTADQLAVLEVAQRNELESLLMEFDQTWTPTLLSGYRNRLHSDGRELFCRVAITELVKIDLQRQWSAGKRPLIEDYLTEIPSLGTPETVAPELILGEYAARRLVDTKLDLSSYASRFPSQLEQLIQLAGQLVDSNLADPPATQPVQASIDTSQIDNLSDTKIGKKSTAAELPTEFGRYRILRELGSGAMGTVYLAHDTQLDRQVALKTPSFNGSDDDDLVARFYREARAAARIQHRNICPIYDVGEIDGRHVISMAFIKGRSLSRYIKPDKLPPPTTSVLLVHRLALALAEAHRHNVIHRDLKPANIMIDVKREPIVMDFGLARQTDVETRMTQKGMAIGTPAYMSPEQVRGNQEEVGPTADIYALGVILYEVLTGRLPFRGPIATVVYQIVNEEPVGPSQIRAEIDTELEAICAKMMAKKRESRYQSMDQVATTLKSYLKGTESKAKVTSKQTSAGAPTSFALSTPTSGMAPLKPDSKSSKKRTFSAFFASQAASDPTGTLIEASLSTPSITTPLDPQETLRVPRRSQRAMKWMMAGLSGAALLVLAITCLVRTPSGTIRVQTVGHLDGLEVLVDGKTISQTAPTEVPAGDRTFGIRLNGAELPFDLRKTQFEVNQVGQECQLSVTIDGVPMRSKIFHVTRNLETILKIAVDVSAPAIAPFNAELYQLAWAKKLGVNVEVTNGLGMKLRMVPPGEFLMGSLSSDTDAHDHEKPQHRVRINKAFYMQTTEVTQEQWFAVMKYLPFAGKDAFREGPQYAMNWVSWHEAVEFCRQLSQTEGVEYRLPSEAQWEYACRAGCQSTYSFGDDADGIADHAWFRFNATDINERYPHEVGRKRPNPLGLFDMHGNVWEWCSDWHGADYYALSPASDPPGPSSGSSRIFRGGSWYDPPWYCRSACRGEVGPAIVRSNLGFRVIRTSVK